MATGDQSGDEPRAQQNAPSSEQWDGLKEDVGEMAGAAVERGRHFLDSAREQATGYADRRKNDAAQTVVDLAHSLRDSGHAFEDRPNIRAFVDGAADGLEQLADTIRARSFADMFNDVEAVMRRRPAAVAAASVLAGLVVARFIKSSAAGLREPERPQAARRPASRRPVQRRQARTAANPSSPAGADT